MSTLWIPNPLHLNAGPPFSYSEAAISTISQTEAFITRIDLRDGVMCIVCGYRSRRQLEHCYIVPKVEDDRWEFMRAHGLIPSQSKSVEHEARNGILLCRNHHGEFDQHTFYIRWVPMSRQFVLINHSRNPDMEEFHGRAVGLFPDNPRTPFHGAFIDQEMRSRGRYPYQPNFADRLIKLPIPWQTWITNAPGGDDKNGGDSSSGGDGGDNGDDADGKDVATEENNKDEDKDAHNAMADDLSSTLVLKCPSQPGEQEGNPSHNTADMNLRSNAHNSSSLLGHPQLVQHQHHIQDATSNTGPATLHKSEKPTMITFTNPMTNPSELEAVIRSARQQPNWKAAVIEGESWEGTAEGNIMKYQQVMPPPDTA